MSQLTAVSWREELQPKRLTTSLTAGLIAGLMSVVLQLSFAALIFSGDDLTPFVSKGIGLALFGALVVSIVTTLLSSYPSVVAVPQGGPAAVLAIVASQISATMLSAGTFSDEAIYATIVGAIIISSLLTGLFFILLGYFQWGNLVRFIPYPVVGGFLAGTGWLLVSGAFKTMTNIPLNLANCFLQLTRFNAAATCTLPQLLSSPIIPLWLTGLIFALLLMLVLKYSNHFLIIPGAIFLGISFFYGVGLASGRSIDGLIATGWLLERFGSGTLWTPPVSFLGLIEWPIVFAQFGSILTITLIVVVSMLLRASGLELTTKQEIDLNRELLASGVANVATSLGGGFVGYPSLSLSVLGHRLRVNSRIIGYTTGIICGFLLFFGAPILSFFPKFVLGGLTIYLGLVFLVEWLYRAWFQLALRDYLMVVVIMVVISAVGFLEGITVGILLTVLLFVVDYSRIRVVKHALSGRTFQSNVDRPRPQQTLLREQGELIYILELQGFIFFGTANELVEQFKERIASSEMPPPKFLVLDFRQVIDVDASAVLSFRKMEQIAQQAKIALVLTDVNDHIANRLERGVPDKDINWLIFPDLDRGVEWCENQLLETHYQSDKTAAQERHQTIFDQMELSMMGAQYANLIEDDKEKFATRMGTSPKLRIVKLTRYLQLKEFAAGEYLIKQGDAPTGMYFIGQGQVSVLREIEGEDPVRLRTMNTGTVVGEIGFYLGSRATASVITEQKTTIYFLSLEQLLKMEQEEPETAVVFHRFIAELLGERLVNTVETLQALLD